MATVAINAPKTPVTKGSNSVAAATLPNVCKMPPPPPPFAPTPLPNIGQSGKQPKGYSTSVKIEGQPVAIQGASFGSSGDIASKATGGGIVSSNAEGPTKFIGPGSLNVKIESKNVQLLGDQMLNNCGPSGSPPNSATMMGAVHAPLMVVMLPEDRPQDKCDACSPKPGSRADVERKSYDEFFSADERAAFDALAAEAPDLVAMLPPKSGKYIRVNQELVQRRRKRYKNVKPKNSRRRSHTDAFFRELMACVAC
jgi:uncharacterized Zn-binding protein involved in type VI secretion